MPPVRPASVLALAIALVGCGGAPSAAADPSDVVRAFVAASERGDVDAVHALLDDASRATVTVEALRGAHDANPEERAAQAAALRGAEARPTTRAEVALASGEEVTLVVEEGAFRVAGGVLESTAPGTPEQAIVGLRHALKRRSLPLFLRVLSRGTRAELEADIARLLEETEDELDLEVAESGDRATVRLGGGGAIELVREAGEWRIEDIR